MDAGVPITSIIGGCAMGLVMDEEDTSKFKVLTDIAGIEDFNGHMDFKVTGSETGVTALQLDMKLKGLSADILEQALQQAKPARIHIISIQAHHCSANHEVCVFVGLLLNIDAHLSQHIGGGLLVVQGMADDVRLVVVISLLLDTPANPMQRNIEKPATMPEGVEEQVHLAHSARLP